MHTAWSRQLTLAICLLCLFFHPDTSYSLDPKFEIDLKALRPKKEQPLESRRETGNEKKSGVSGKGPAAVSGRNAGAKAKVGVPDIRDKDIRRPPPASSSVTAGKSQAPHSSGTASYKPKSVMRDSSPKRPKVVKRSASGYPAARLGFHMGRMPFADREDVLLQAKTAWAGIVAKGSEGNGPVSLKGNNFSISLDPVRYPVFQGIDGVRVIVDADGTLSKPMRALIEEKEPSVRIVTEPPENRKRFYSALLAAARFYSVEENFSLSFGSDPKITVTSDFKIEKSPESLLDNDILLLNVTEHHLGMPPSLRSMLGREGFGVIEASQPPQAPAGKRRNLLYSVKGFDQRAIVDTILTAACERISKDREIALDDGSRSGVTLTVKADRYLVSSGKKIILSFSGVNPIQQTLVKLLQSKGYQVVAIHPDDGFKEISEKLSSILKFHAQYGMHHLWNPRNELFDVQMSGFVLSVANRKVGSTFVTDVGIDPVMRDLLDYKGYEVVEK